MGGGVSKSMLGLNAAIIDVENTKLSKTSHIQ